MESQENRENARIWYDSPSVSKSSNRKTSFLRCLNQTWNLWTSIILVLQSSKRVGPNFEQNKGYLRGLIDNGARFPRFRSIQGPLQWRWFTMEQYGPYPPRETRKHIPPRGVSENHRLKKRQTVRRRICYMLVSRTINTHNNKSIKNYYNSKEIPHYTSKPKRNLLSSTSRKTSTAPFLCDQIVSRDHELLSLHVQDLHCLPCHCQNTPLVFCFFPLWVRKNHFVELVSFFWMLYFTLLIWYHIDINLFELISQIPKKLLASFKPWNAADRKSVV